MAMYSSFSPPKGKIGLMVRPPVPQGKQPSYPQLEMLPSEDSTFQVAIDDMFWYMNANPSDQDSILLQTSHTPNDIEQRRLIDLVPSTSYHTNALPPVNRMRIYTSKFAPDVSKIGEEGVPMQVFMENPAKKYYYAKVMPVESMVNLLDDAISERGKDVKTEAKAKAKTEAALSSFREVMINLSLFPSMNRSLSGPTPQLPVVAPMYNWFFTSIKPNKPGFMEQFDDMWHPVVFKTFYGSRMKKMIIKACNKDLEMLLQQKENKDQVANGEIEKLYKKYQKLWISQDLQKSKVQQVKDAINECKNAAESYYSNLAIRGNMENLSTLYSRVFQRDWRSAGPERALVLISESVGEISLENAYSKHGYAFPFSRFLGKWNMPTQFTTRQVTLRSGDIVEKKVPVESSRIRDVDKRYAIVFSRRPFASLMMHVLAISKECKDLGLVHGDFHSGNMIAIPVKDEGSTVEDRKTASGKDIPRTTPGWYWNMNYRDNVPLYENNRQGNNIQYGCSMQYNNLPLYVDMAPRGRNLQLPFPYTLQWPAQGVDAGRYLQFTLIDLGFAYRDPRVIASSFKVNPMSTNQEEQKRWRMINAMWDKAVLSQRGIYPTVYHPWYDTFRLGMYMCNHVINAISYQTKDPTTNGPVDIPCSIVGRSRGNVMFELILRMMTPPAWLDGSGQHSRFYIMKNGIEPQFTIENYYDRLMNRIYSEDTQYLMVSRFSIEFVTFALYLTNLPKEWKNYANTENGKPEKEKNQEFLKCHGAINLMRHFMLVIVNIYRTFEVYTKTQEPAYTFGFRYRDPSKRSLDMTRLPNQELFDNPNYIKNVREARSIANSMFTRSLTTVIDSVGLDANYMSPDSIINDKLFWSVLI